MAPPHGGGYLLGTMALSSITWRDVRQMPDDGRRREAIAGDLHVTAAPSLRHQRISHRLAVALHEVLERPGHGILAAAPVGVEFPATGEGVQPDLVFVSDARSEIVDPEAGTVEAWDFRGEEPRCRRFSGAVPVRAGDETVGEIDLAEVFARQG